MSSAVDVFKQELKLDVARKNLVRKEAPFPGMSISIILGMTGTLCGQVVYSMDYSFAEQACRAMLAGGPPADVAGMTHGALSELANIITGQATIALAGQSEKIDRTPPVVLTASAAAFDFGGVGPITYCFKEIARSS